MAELNIDSLSRLTVPELQQELKKRGLKKIGVKTKLIQRLSEYLIKYGTEIVMVTPQNQPNCSSENPETLEESGIENSFSEELDSSHAIEELANSIHRSQDFQDNGTRKVNIDSEVNDEAINNETNERLVELDNQEDNGWNQENIDCDKESSITNVLHMSEEHSNDPTNNTEEIDEEIDNKEARNTDPSQEFQYEEDSIEVDPKLFIEENNDSSKVGDNEFQNQKTEEITNEALVDEGEIVSEDDEENVKKLKQKTVKPVPLKKRVSLQGSVESVEEKAAKRKRRWGSTSKNISDQNSESIKKLITEDKTTVLVSDDQPELDYQEEDDRDTGASNANRRKVKVESGKIISLGKRTNPEVLVVEDAGESAPKSVDIIFAKPTYVDEDSEMQGKRDRSPSPARNPVSCYIHITGLVRPFTVNQLKVLIGRTGTISENGFWINQVKSHCYVQLSSEEQAAATRNALHGLKWPSGTPKVLKVDFALNTQIWEDTQGLMGGKPKIVIEIEDKNENKNEEKIEDKKVKKQKEVEKKDRTKETKRKDSANRKDKKREESPAKLLDDLFRKTKATPCIYWLPLTDEQILNREKKIPIEHNENPNITKTSTNKENKTSRRSRSLNRPVRGRR
ncbi:apoptotic chromatin condensation inducer in the nucleus isoform X1 [Hydra vulgaris]|uniref:apoptotic chromatin condensation inducer in the nucleus isoform X1 n=1 Tax=Hydra vulgaris TaxID=6087 RepID=UPI001F5E6D6E|nr:apoptotic chromatin condensation inducer in the nucleus [Hydra vulgaris]